MDDRAFGKGTKIVRPPEYRIQSKDIWAAAAEARKRLNHLEREFKYDTAVHLYSVHLQHKLTPNFPIRYWASWPQDKDVVYDPKSRDVFTDEHHLIKDISYQQNPVNKLDRTKLFKSTKQQIKMFEMNPFLYKELLSMDNFLERDEGDAYFFNPNQSNSGSGEVDVSNNTEDTSPLLLKQAESQNVGDSELGEEDNAMTDYQHDLQLVLQALKVDEEELPDTTQQFPDAKKELPNAKKLSRDLLQELIEKDGRNIKLMGWLPRTHPASDPNEILRSEIETTYRRAIYRRIHKTGHGEISTEPTIDEIRLADMFYNRIKERIDNIFTELRLVYADRHNEVFSWKELLLASKIKGPTKEKIVKMFTKTSDNFLKTEYKNQVKLFQQGDESESSSEDESQYDSSSSEGEGDSQNGSQNDSGSDSDSGSESESQSDSQDNSDDSEDDSGFDSEESDKDEHVSKKPKLSNQTIDKEKYYSMLNNTLDALVRDDTTLPPIKIVVDTAPLAFTKPITKETKKT